jgi:hypothetical protein
MILSVAAADAPQTDKDIADYVCDGVNDQVEIQAALDAVAKEKISYGGNGGTVYLVGRRFNISANVGVPTQAVLDAQDAWFFALKWTGYTGDQAGVVQLATPNTQYAQVRNLNINVGNVDVCGVYVGVAGAQEWDAFIRLENLFIVNAGQHSVRWDNLSGGKCRGNMASNIRSLNPKGSGFYVNCPDSFYHMLDSGSSGSHGFTIVHSNGRFTSCKAWFSDGSGFYFAKGRDNQLAACESQDNLNHGYELSSKGNVLSACKADSNGYNGVKTSGQPTNLGSGFYVTAPGNIIQGSASDKNESGRGVRQQYPLQVVGKVSLKADISATGNVNADPSLGQCTTPELITILSY